MSFKTRTTFYSLTLTFGVFQAALSFMNMAFSSGYTFAPFMEIFAGLTGGWAMITWIWTSVLLSYNNRPLSTHDLTRAEPHFASFTVFAVGWLALTVMLGQQFLLQCDYKTPSDGLAYVWGPMGATSFVLSFALFVFSVTCAAVVYFSARRTGAGPSANVAHGDKMESIT